MTLLKNKKNECDHTPKNEILIGDITFFRARTEVFIENHTTSPEVLLMEFWIFVWVHFRMNPHLRHFFRILVFGIICLMKLQTNN